MRFAINLPNIGPYADVRAMADLARLAEDCGWEGLFVWDHVTWLRSDPQPVAGPVDPADRSRARHHSDPVRDDGHAVARRRPTKLARETVTLERLSGGRLTLGVGLGSPLDDEFAATGEPADPKLVATRLDEGLDILATAWSGKPVNYHGTTHRVDGVTFLPRPIQRPRIPVWVGGTWPKRRPIQRALRWDGAVFTYLDDTSDRASWRSPTPAEIAELAALARRERGTLDGYDIVVGGRSLDEDAHLVAPLAAAGATWWQESLGPHQGDWDDTINRIQLGPPRRARNLPDATCPGLAVTDVDLAGRLAHYRQHCAPSARADVLRLTTGARRSLRRR